MKYIKIKELLLLLFSVLTNYLLAAMPSFYYNSLEGKSSAILKTELHNIIMQDTSRYLKYGSGAGRTWEGFYNTDRDLNTDAVIDMYSANLRYFPSPNPNFVSFGQEIHIEHSVPKSWWNSYEWAAYKDLNHLYPADGSTNISKSNNPLGVVSGVPTKNNGVSKIGPASYVGYVGNVFEPADEFKGDFARTYFYMATAYEHYVNVWDTTKPENMMQNNSYPVLKPWAVELLLEWHRQDPVSDKERTRADVVYSIQGNRNPFIDYPELVEYIWGSFIGTPWRSLSTSIEATTFNLEIKYNASQNTLLVASDETIPIDIILYTVDAKVVWHSKSFTNCEMQIQNIHAGILVSQIITNQTVVTQKFLVK